MTDKDTYNRETPWRHLHMCSRMSSRQNSNYCRWIMMTPRRNNQVNRWGCVLKYGNTKIWMYCSALIGMIPKYICNYYSLPCQYRTPPRCTRHSWTLSCLDMGRMRWCQGKDSTQKMVNQYYCMTHYPISLPIHTQIPCTVDICVVWLCFLVWNIYNSLYNSSIIWKNYFLL